MNSGPHGKAPFTRVKLHVFARDLLVAAGEQEDFHSFFAPQQPGAAFGNLTVSLSKKGHLLGHGPHPGGLFWRAAEADGLRAVFLLLACCYQEAPRITVQAVPSFAAYTSLANMTDGSLLSKTHQRIVSNWSSD